MSDDIRAMFKAKAVPAPGRGSRDTVSLFVGSIDTQIKKAKDMQSDKSVKTSATNWFKPYDGGYLLQLGKKPMDLDGNTHWKVDTLDEVIAMYEEAKKLTQADVEFQTAIRKAAKKAPVSEPSTAAAPRQKTTRKPKK